MGMRASKDYPLTCNALENAGFIVDEVAPEWEQPFEGLVAHTAYDLRKKIGNGTLVIAHSLGANIALPEVIHHPGIGLVIASPSVAYAEGCEFDAGLAIIEEAFPGQRKSVQNFSLAALAKAVQTPPERIAVTVGEVEVKEFPFMGELAQLAAESVGTEVTHIPLAPHFIDHSSHYIQAVTDAATRISHELTPHP
jgi:hypothetical protein